MQLKIFQKSGLLIKILIAASALILIIEVICYISGFFEINHVGSEMANQHELQKPKPETLFNLPIDSFIVVPGHIRPGQNLSDILLSNGITMTEIDEISRKSIQIFDTRKMRVNNPYYVFKNKENISQVEYFVYEINTIEYIVYQLRDSLRVYKDIKPIETQVKTANGIISVSLWETMESENINPILAMELSDIYAWNIDFFGIKKGDKFSIIYEENYAYGKSIGIGQILASRFVHSNEDFYAFYFSQNSEESYFDENGRSLKKAFLKAPLKFSRISSGFSTSRFHPILKIRRPHYGVDYAAPAGTPVVSIGDGTVIAKAYQAAGGGNYLKIKHNSVYTTSYMHLSKFASGISVGVRVNQGQVIGYVGATGLASGPHLDFRVFMNGSPVDPLKIKAPPIEPISDNNMKIFTTHRDSMMYKLENIKKG